MIVKGGAAIEQLGEARTVVLDKTGTLTLGTPEVERVVLFDGLDRGETLRLAASLDQLSAHALAEALVLAARREGLALSFPEDVDEGAGQGAEGVVDGRRVAVGSEAWLEERGYPVPPGALGGLDGDEPRQCLQDGHLSPKRAVGRGELDADDAAADNDEVLGHLLE